MYMYKNWLSQDSFGNTVKWKEPSLSRAGVSLATKHDECCEMEQNDELNENEDVSVDGEIAHFVEVEPLRAIGEGAVLCAVGKCSELCALAVERNVCELVEDDGLERPLDEREVLHPNEVLGRVVLVEVEAGEDHERHEEDGEHLQCYLLVRNEIHDEHAVRIGYVDDEQDDYEEDEEVTSAWTEVAHKVEDDGP